MTDTAPATPTTSAFDAHRPPSAELAADCVHCGFCLPTCPTYVLWSEEMDSPRGRIYLMQGLVDGSIDLTDTVVEHFDRCLGCMACVSSCPSGVQYDRLIEQTRDYVERNHRRGPLDRLVRAGVFAVFPHRRRLRAALLFRKLPAPGPLRCRFRNRFMQRGLFEEDGEMWDSSGALVAQSRQLALIPRG